ncbi:MAG TPA: class I poly(R)-hydroxyalkanoic acid synthase [Geminicoccus sp.]|uniref:class I poly(R)-hydroxyalkanoic acid synthase n=1 Tax=Geminicoccus sp. TaxID=2024832 RepID=UPI002D0E2647|nr:class I poly(R)-hydroxyalkanoic acid synthase [Geminicoccus sp.]HWL69830.1 class I poly(R)-hydroxyalkanoic acid synthase [Geminicoccus sp.]
MDVSPGPVPGEAPDGVLGQRGSRAAGLAERAARVVKAMLERHAADRLSVPDPEVVGDAFAELGRALLQDPERLAQAQLRLWLDHGRLWNAQLLRLLGGEAPVVAAPAPGDRRFRDQVWTEAPVYDWLKQSYLVNAAWLRDMVAEAPGLAPASRARIEFYTRQLIDACAPTNFAFTNPAVLARAAETGGESLLDGLEHLLADMERSQGEFAPAMAPRDAFRLGRDIATSKGSVIFRNELIELIQYAPTTPTVARRPLLIVPPWINKFYILDLRPDNSFIRWATGQGLTVFLISWVNPDARLAAKTFEDYLREGPLAAMAAIERQTGERTINIIGYCLGGTLTACLLAHLAASGQAERIASATLFTCLTDFSDPGEVSVFIDAPQIAKLEQHMERTGFLEAGYMAKVFAMLRANDLIWAFAINNYLMGKEPAPFDLLHWNADGTRMPMKMHAFYLREMYLENRLVEPGGITLLGTPLDLGRIGLPVFFLSTQEDHIAPWKSTYAGSRRFGGPVRFVLGGSGHIAGVINPAGSTKYGYRTDGPDTDDPEAWLAGSTEHPGSWWPHWRAWLKDFDGDEVPARDPEQGPLPVLDPAPGQNVLVRADR